MIGCCLSTAISVRATKAKRFCSALLTHPEPLTSRHGELSEDEEAIAVTSVAEHFYKHLASLKNGVQFIVIENSTPPASIRGLARIKTFTHVEGNGRFGMLARSNVAPLST